jgi:signal transduction histidine kinase
VTPSLDELWLRSLQKLTAHIAHDLKGALNGVSVNLEVVRARSEKETSTGADVHRFAAAAADQLGIVIRSTTALLSLARGTKGPVEVSMIARQVASLLEDTASASPGRFALSIEGGLAAETSAPLHAVRLALAECLLSAGSGKGEVAVRVRGLPTPVVHITPAPDPDLPREVTSALAGAGIRLTMDGHGISIMLPGPADLPH